MLTLEEYRAIYPEDAGLTDFEVTEKFRQARYPHMDAAAFAAQFGGPTQEDPVELAARNYNRANPDSPITAQAIRDKDRSGPLGYLRLLGEGIFDAVTDQLPEDMARIVRAGDISPEQRGTADEIIARQQRDSSRRIPSRQEAEGSTLATSLYQGPRSVATSMATGIGGMALGGAAGTVFPGVGTALGSMAGAGALSGAAFYRMAKDQFVEEMQRAGMARLGRPLSQEEAERLNAAIDDEATRFGLWEAGPEAVSQFFTAGLLGGAGGKILQKIGLGSLGEAIGKRAITRIPAKLGAEVGEEESTEGITFMGQEGIRQDMGLRPDAPTVSEFLKEQAGPVAVGALLQMGGMRGAQYLKDRYDARRQARELERQLADTEAVASEAMPKTADTPPLSNFDTSLGGPEWNPPAPRFDEAAWNREASERGWQHLRSDASEISAGQPPSPAADVTETSLALDAGKPLDLLAPPSPETPATPPVARQEPVAMPDMPRPAAAQPAVPPVPETAQSRLPDPQNNDGILARLGRPDAAAPQLPRPASPIAAPASGIELPSSPAQPVSSARPSARVPSLPTQAQLTRTQEAPRADTTAQAQALRLPAPETLPREAQTPTAPPPPPAAPMQPIPAAPSAPAMQPTPPPAPTQTTAGPPPYLPTPAPQPTAGPVLPPEEPVAIPQELAGLSRKEMIQRLPRQLRSKADFMGTEEMRSLLARRHAATQASTPPATREKRERQEPTQADKTGEEAPPTYYGKPISRPPIGDARREEAANRILAGAAARARAAGHQDMSAAVEALQREREMVGVTHDALWNRIIRDIQPYADEGMESDAARLPAGSTGTREGRAAEADSERTSLQGSDAAETADRQQEEKARPRIVIKSLVSGKEEYLDAAGSSPQSRNDEGHTRPAGTEATDKDASAEAVSPSGRYGTVAAPDTVALASRPVRRPDSTSVKVIDVAPGIVPEFSKARDLARWLKAYFADRREETILSTGKRVRFSNSNLEASLKRGRETEHNQAYGRLNDLVRHAAFDSFEGKDARHPNLGGQEVYYSALRIGDRLYAVRFKMDVPGEQEVRIRKEWRGEKNTEDLRYKDHALREIEIAPILYRGVVPENGVPTQTTEAISTISLDVLRDAVKPSRLENGALSSVQVAGQFLPPRRQRGRRHTQATLKIMQRYVATLNARSTSMTHAELIERQDDLPDSLRRQFADTSVEGLYDPSNDVVWLIAENLETPQRAVEVWAHEMLVHHGLRATFDKGERQRLLQHIWMSLGGMKHPLIAQAAQNYGKDPLGDKEARLIVVEEALAKLAEQRAKELPSSWETGWRRVVAAVLRAWHMLVRRITSRDGSMNAAGIDRLLDSLQAYVVHGKGVHKAALLPDEGALASLGETQEEAAHTAWRQLQEDMAAWGRQVDDFAAGKGNSVRALHVGRTPDVLVQLGARQLPMQMEQRNLKKILSKHDVPLETLKELPASLATPFMVFKSATMADAYVVLTEMERNGENLVAAIHFDVNAGRLQVNDIASVHDRSVERDGTTIPGWVWIKGQIEKGNLRYYDKTRSPRWFRERAGLQLSSVVNRGDYRGIRILTDKDVVKPEAPSGEAPLASLRAPSVSLTERANAVVRRLRKIAGRGVSEDVEALLRDPEQGRLIPREDLGKMERLLKLPHWVAKDHPGFAAIYNRQLRRVDERRTAVLAATQRAPLLFDTDAGKRLNADEEQRLAAMIWKWDGKEIGPLHGIEKFIVTGTSLNGREELALNPRYQEKFRAWLREQPEPERVKEAFAQVRSLLDESFLHAYGRMTQMADLADTDLEMFRTEMGNLPNYFPHQRKGKYYVEATAVGPDGKRELVYRQHFDVPLGSSVREEWAKIVEANKKDYPGATWHNPKEVVQLPDDILGAPIDPQAMEQLINTTVQRRIKDGEQAEEVRKALLSGLADVLKARGFGAHAIQRKNIPGFEKEDVKGILYNYISGLHGWLSKMDASADFAQALGKIHAAKSPELWSFASQYVRDMLRNTDSIDRIAGNIKTAAFVWYLGGNIKTAEVNSTQNLIVGVPRLQQEVTGGGALWLKAAMDTLGLRFSGRGIAGAKKLTADELRMLEELYGAGVIADAHMDEIRGQMARSPALRMWERLVRVLGLPMSIVEHFNRASLALAAYRAARAGRLSTSACRRLGIREGEKLSHDAARDFADMLVRDTHFEYGKGNAPELLRSTTAGRMLSPAFVFRSFSGNIINLWWRALRHEGREGRVFVAKSLGATVALGGLTAFPFYATLSALCTALSGDDEDWTTKVRRRLPESNLLRDVVCYGLPSLGGVTIGGSLRMETPFTEGIEKGTTFKDIMTQSLVSLIGVPYDLTVNKVSRALEAHSYGADDRALEALVPTFMANIMQAYRLSTEGQTTLRGRPINSPGRQGARKLDAYEAVGKALGFQPTSSAKSYAAYKGDQLRTTVRSELIDDFTVQALKDLESKGRPYMMRELRKRLQTWNAAREAEGKTGMKIMPKDVLRRVASRRRENSQSQKQRAKGAAQMALWGV